MRMLVWARRISTANLGEPRAVIIAPTRELMGLILQGVAGGVGGYCYHLVSWRPPSSDIIHG